MASENRSTTAEQMLFIDPLHELVRVRQYAPHHRGSRLHLHRQQRRQKRFDDLFHARRSAGSIQHLKPATVNRLDAPLDKGIDQALLGLEMIVDRRQIDLRFGSDIALSDVPSNPFIPNSFSAAFRIRVLVSTMRRSRSRDHTYV